MLKIMIPNTPKSLTKPTSVTTRPRICVWEDVRGWSEAVIAGICFGEWDWNQGFRIDMKRVGYLLSEGENYLCTIDSQGPC